MQGGGEGGGAETSELSFARVISRSCGCLGRVQYVFVRLQIYIYWKLLEIFSVNESKERACLHLNLTSITETFK